MNDIVKMGKHSAPTSRHVSLAERNATGIKSVPDGRLEAEIEVEIDWDYIKRFMIPRALRSNGKRAKSGPVVVRARNLKHIK